MSPRTREIKHVRPENTKQTIGFALFVGSQSLMWTISESIKSKRKSTSKDFFRPSLGQQSKILQRNYDSLYVPEHSREAETEEHDKEEDSPDRRHRHLDDGFCEHNEGQPCSLHALKKNTSHDDSTTDILHKRKSINNPTDLTQKELHVTSP